MVECILSKQTNKQTQSLIEFDIYYLNGFKRGIYQGNASHMK